MTDSFIKKLKFLHADVFQYLTPTCGNISKGEIMIEAMCTVCVWPLKQFFNVVRPCLITDFYILGTAAKHIKTILSLADLFSVLNPAPPRFIFTRFT